MYAYFSRYASALLIVDSLFLPKGGEGLAGEARDVEMYGGVGFDVWFVPRISPEFAGFEIVPYELSGA